MRWPRGSGPRGGNCLPWLPGLHGGQTGLAYQGPLIPNSALPQYLRGSNYGFIEVDWNKFAKDTNYQYFRDNIYKGFGKRFGRLSARIVTGAYVEVNGKYMLF